MNARGLAVDRAQDGNRTVVALHGALDERFDLIGWGAQLPSPLVIDLGDVDFINSAGMSQWVHFLADAVGRGPVIVRRCSEPMVTLFSMVTDAVSGATVESIQAHYVCARCDREQVIELAIGADVAPPAPGGELSMPERTCAACGGVLQFAGHPERYLAFLRNE